MCVDKIWIFTNMSEQTGASSSSSQSAAQHTLDTFWPRTIDEIKSLNNVDFKNQELPLARIKKIMKLDDDVKVMVSLSFTPFLLCNIFKVQFVSFHSYCVCSIRVLAYFFFDKFRKSLIMRIFALFVHS